MKNSKQSKVHKYIEKYIHWATNHPFPVLVIALCLAMLAWLPVSKLRIDANLEDLLPQDTPTLEAMRETSQRYGSADLFTLAIQMDDPVEIARIQDFLKNEIIKKWDDVLWVQVDRDNKFFMDHALMYLPTQHLQRVAQNLRDLQLEIGMERTPFGVDLLSDLEGVETEPKASQREWFNASLPQELGLPDEAAEAFSEFLKPDTLKKTNGSIQHNSRQGIPDSLKNRLLGFHLDGTYNGLLQAALKKPSSDTRFVQSIIERTELLLQPLRDKYGMKLNIGIEGPYSNLEEVESLKNNGTLATLISLVAVVFLIISFFRSLGGVLAIIIQVAFSCFLTMACAGLIYGRLNLYTVFVVSIILGMGIDYSIHFLGHAQIEAQKGKSWSLAFIETASTLTTALLLAATTTIAGLLTLLVADFVGFYEFGVIASVGIAISVLTSLTLLPALIAVLNKLEGIPVLKFLALPNRPQKTLWPQNWSPDKWNKVLHKSALVTLMLTLILTPFILKAEFEFDFKNLRDTHKKAESGRHIGVALQNTKRRSSQPVVVLAQSPRTLEILHDTLMQRLTIEKDSLLRSFLTLSTFVPSRPQQDARLSIIREIDTLVSARVFDRAEGSDKKMIDRLRSMVRVQPFGPLDIPKWALHLVQERDGSYGKIGFIYGNFNSSNALEAAAFQERYGKFHLNGEDVKLFSSSFIFAEIIQLVKKDSEIMGILIMAIITLTLALSLRNVRLLTVSLVTLSTGIIATMGLMGLFGIKLGPFNLILVPTVLGVSIDTIIHLSLAYQRYGKNNLKVLYQVTGSLVLASIITTIAGYIGMLFTSHLGVTSIGSLALISFCAFMVIGCILTPWLCIKLKVPTLQ